MTERWQNMTPQQREQMKQQWRDHCGGWGRGRWKQRQPQIDQSSPDEYAETDTLTH